MDSLHIGVIPEASSLVSFVEISLNWILAIGIEHSIYLFEVKTGENICRINHYPSKVLAATWHPNQSFLISGDSNGDILKSVIPTSTTKIQSVSLDLISITIHPFTQYTFILYQSQILVLNESFNHLSIIPIGGFKLILDYFSPWKITIAYKKGLKVIQDWAAAKVQKGKIKGILDAIQNPSTLNSVFILTASKLIEFDTYSMRTSKMLMENSYKMTKILSVFSTEIWTLSTSGIVSPLNTLIPGQFLAGFGGFWTSDDKLPVCLVKPNLEIQFGLISNTLSIKSKVQLGVHLKLWDFGIINEKVLVFFLAPFIMCFSFTKERIIRKVKVDDVTALTCALHHCFFIQEQGKVTSWKMNSGEMKVIKVYSDKTKSVLVNKKASFLVVACENFIEIFSFNKGTEKIQRLDVVGASVMTWSDDDRYLYICTSREVLRIKNNEDIFEPELLISAQLNVTEILEVSGELFIENQKTWYKFVTGSGTLVPELIEKIDEINIGSAKAEFKPFGLLYRNIEKKMQVLNSSYKSEDFENRQLLEKSSKNLKFSQGLVDKLQCCAEQKNSVKEYLFWRVMKEYLDNVNEEVEEQVNDKSRTRIREKALLSSPGNITPTRRPVKRSISPLNKTRKSITPQRIQKMQTDPKDIIQLAVDTSCLLNSTQNFQKDPVPKMYYILEKKPVIKGSLSTPSDFLNNDKKALVKKLLSSSDDKDLLLGCIVAGTLGRQDLQKAIESSCQKLSGFTGVLLNLAIGSKSKAFELLNQDLCYEDIALYSKLSNKLDEFFTFITKLYEDGFKFICALQLFFSGFTQPALQVLYKAGEEELVYWLSQVFKGSLKNKSKVPPEFENWFYELGPPRFKNSCDEEISVISAKFEKQ